MFCISCGTKAASGDKFCLKCGKPIVAPPEAAPTYNAPPKTAGSYVPPTYTEQPKITEPYTPSTYNAPPKTADPYAAPTYNAPPKTAEPYAPPTYTAQPKITDPYAPPAYNAQPYHAPQPATQSAKPVVGRKGKLTPVIIASVAVVAVALIAVVLFFALGTGTKDQSDYEDLGDSLSDTEEVDLNEDDTDSVQDSEADSEPDTEPADSPPPEDDEADEEDEDENEFMLTGDGSGFIFNGLEFQVFEVDLNPMFEPAFMPSGHMPFIVSFTIFEYDSGAAEVLSLLYSMGYFVVGDEEAEFGAALLGDENADRSVYSLVSSCTRIGVNTPITLYIGDNAFIIR